MYGNPYLNGYREPQTQQPIQNIINAQIPTGNDIFMARYLKENENVDNVLITNKTAFIDLTNKQLIIKEIDGDKKIYEIVLPKDAKDIEIDNLKREIDGLKEMISHGQYSNNATNIEITESDGNVKKSSRK